jgi:hypothetical protein
MSVCCDKILKAIVTNCDADDDIKINIVGVAPYDPFTVTVTDRFANKFQGDCVAGDGYVLIPKSEFPAGIFDVPGTSFLIERGVLNNCVSEKFIIANAYDAIEVEIVGGNSDDREIGCEVNCL